MSKSRKEFIEKATLEYGAGAIMNRKMIRTVADKYDLSYPFWLTNDHSARVGRGRYKLPLQLNQADFVKPQPQVAPTTNKEFDFDVCVPAKFEHFIPFGFYEDLKVIVSSKAFFPVFISGLSGNGKCLGRDTPVLMYDGTIKMVQDIVVGDVLMGDDSKPRNVLSLARGREMMYKVVPNKGEPYIVNESHILSLKSTNSKEKIDISVNEYLQKSTGFKKEYKGYRVPVEFLEQDLPIDPYFFGLWLGDGDSSGPYITTADSEIIEYSRGICEEYGLMFVVKEDSRNSNVKRVRLTQGKVDGKTNKNKLTEDLRCLGVLNNKHIPQIYKVNSRKNRLALLAGLIDTDGHVNAPKSLGYTTMSKQLNDDVLFLCRSLGYAAYTKVSPAKLNGKTLGDCYHISISGDFSELPLKLERKVVGPRKMNKDVLVTGIKLEQLHEDEYFGFSIDGNRRFLLGDFTVTHNTLMVEQVCAELGRECVRVNISRETDESDLIGSKTLVDGNIEFHDGPVLVAMKRGAILLIDEVDRGSDKLMCLQAILEGKPYFNKKTGEVIAAQPGFNVVATANSKGRGSEDGRYLSQILDSAFLERFAITVEQKFPDTKIEIKILKSMTDNDVFVNTLIKWADVVRKSFDEGAIDEVISTRRLVHIVNTYNIFKDTKKALNLCVSLYEADVKDALIDLYTKIEEPPEKEVKSSYIDPKREIEF